MTGVIAQGAPGGTRPYKHPPNLLEYFKGKYVHVDDWLIARLQETPDGPLGQISVYGKISPKADVGGMVPEDRARAIALAFIAEEAALGAVAGAASCHPGASCGIRVAHTREAGAPISRR